MLDSGEGTKGLERSRRAWAFIFSRSTLLCRFAARKISDPRASATRGGDLLVEAASSCTPVPQDRRVRQLASSKENAPISGAFPRATRWRRPRAAPLGGARDNGGMTSRMSLVLALALATACGTSSSHSAATRTAGPTRITGGDKAACEAFQRLATALVAHNAEQASAALADVRAAASGATSAALKADATGLAGATNGPAAAGFGRRIPEDCKAAGVPLTHP